MQPVRVITQTESWKQEVQLDVVERLKELLAKAESGEIQGFAYAAYCADCMTMTGYSKNIHQSALIGGLERVKHRMLAAESA